MPKGGKLRPDEVDALVAWIKAGAPWPASAATADSARQAPDTVSAGSGKASKPYVITPQQRAFWSSQAIHIPAVPAVLHGDCAKSDIDRFVLARLELEGLAP